MRNRSEIEAIIRPIVESLGYELWGCVRVTQPRRSILRVYIDNERGINLSDCERVSRQLSAVLDVEYPSFIQSRYNLEVSSPGLNRPLFIPDQFKRFLGSRVSVQTHRPLDKQRRFKGILKITNDVGILIVEENGEERLLAWDNILSANVMPEIIK